MKKPPTLNQGPPAVEVTKVIQQDVPITNTWIGNLAPLVNAEIRAQVSGYLIEQDYRDGAKVAKGDVLFRIDPRPFQATLDQANASFAQAEAQYTKAALNAQRAQELFKTQVISQQQYDDEVQAYEAAKASADAAKAIVDQAEINLNFCTITSPIDGIAGISQAQIGDLVGPGSPPLTNVMTIDPLKIQFTISEQNYLSVVKPYLLDKDRLRGGETDQLKFQVILADGSIYPETGTFYAINNQMGVNTGSIQIEGRIANPSNLLRPGQFARVYATIQIAKDALLVPQQAVMDTQGISQLAKVGDAHKVTIQTVETGAKVGDYQIIEKGIQAGDTIVVEGLQKVRTGVEVRPSPYTAPHPPPSVGIQNASLVEEEPSTSKVSTPSAPSDSHPSPNPQ